MDDYESPRFMMKYACMTNNDTMVSSLLSTTPWSMLDLLLFVIKANHTSLYTWNIIIPLLSTEEVCSISSFIYIN